MCERCVYRGDGLCDLPLLRLRWVCFVWRFGFGFWEMVGAIDTLFIYFLLNFWLITFVFALQRFFISFFVFGFGLSR